MLIWEIIVFIIVFVVEVQIASESDFKIGILCGVFVAGIGIFLWTICTEAVVLGTVIGFICGRIYSNRK